MGVGIGLTMTIDDKQVLKRLNYLSKQLYTTPDAVAKRVASEIIDRANKNLNASLVQPQGAFRKWKEINPTGYGPEVRISQSWKIVNSGKGTVSIENESPHAVLKEYGTGPKITGGDYYMTFYAYDRWIRVKMARGQAPTYFFSNAIKSVEKDILHLTKDELVKKIPMLIGK